MKKLKIGSIAAIAAIVLAIGAANTDEKKDDATRQESTVVQEETTNTIEDDAGAAEQGADEQSEQLPESPKEPETVTGSVGTGKAEKPDFSGIPVYAGELIVPLNDNVPNFSAVELTTVGYETYGELDGLGRCTYAVASLGRETMPGPNEKRGDISSIKPSGWVQAKYDNVSGKYLYNRCHLIGWQLSAENANRSNLITGTRYFNVEGMLPFENMVADYIKETDNHVAYRVTPVYDGDNLVCHGVQIEAYSIEDQGEEIQFNVFCYNVQPDITIDYATGASTSSLKQEVVQEPTPTPEPTPQPEPQPETGSGDMVWIPTKGGKKYHAYSGCSGMKDPNYVTRQEASNRGFDACKKCY